MKAKKHPDKALQKKRAELVAVLRESMIHTMVKRAPKIKNRLNKACIAFIRAVQPPAEHDPAYELAVSAVRADLRVKRSTYLAEGKLIPDWPWDMEYQNKVVSGLLTILEPRLNDRIRIAQARGRKKPRH